jgi:hypothetical protein
MVCGHHPCACMQRVVDELNQSVSSLERLRDNFEYKDAQGKDHVRLRLLLTASQPAAPWGISNASSGVDPACPAL